MKKKRLFYYEEAINAWTPAPKELDLIINEDNLDDGEEMEIQFRVWEMTDEEFKNLPVE